MNLKEVSPRPRPVPLSKPRDARSATPSEHVSRTTSWRAAVELASETGSQADGGPPSEDSWVKRVRQRFHTMILAENLLQITPTGGTPEIRNPTTP